jgi:hypothetical protein
MRKALLSIVGLAIAVALVAPALGLGSADGRKVSDSKVLAAVSEPYTGQTNAIRGLPGGGLPWEIGDATADLRADGRLHVDVEGLVLARRAPVPADRQGTNPIPRFAAVVSCLTTSGGAATTVNVSTPSVPASASGDAEIDATVALPSPCFAPIVFVTNEGGGAWFAVTGR